MNDKFLKRKKRVRSKVSGTADRPRLVVFKSNRSIHAQVVNDQKGVTLAYVDLNDLGKIDSLGLTGLDIPREIGKRIAEKLLKLKIKRIVFDKSGYIYHGKIKAVAEGAREGGLEF